MFKRYLLLLVFIISCSLTFFSQPRVEAEGFYMRNFYVSIDKASVRKNDMPIRWRHWRELRSPFEDYQAVFSGKGFILIHNKKVPITFKNVKISKHPQDRIFIAVSGVVSGKKTSFFRRKQIKYSLNGFEIKMSIRSINIEVKSATAAVAIGLHNSTYYTDTANSLILKSGSCNIEPNGAIEGKNFHGSTAFDLKDSVYRLKLRQPDEQVVRLGSFLSGRRVIPRTIPQIAPKPLIRINGFVYRDNIELFSFSGNIKPDQKQAVFSLILLGPIERFPEPDYVLSLLSGRVKYEYNKYGLQLCEGSFQANLKLPNTIRNEDDTEIELENIILKTDKTGILFNNVTVPKKIKTGYSDDAQRDSNIFLIEPKEGSAWINFPIWHRDTHHSSYNIKGTDPCEKHYHFLDPPGGVAPNELRMNAHKRPGLTILQGILYFKAPQATFGMDTPVSLYNLKTPFWGALTCTPWGITGELTSSGYSFVPSNRDIDECSVPVDSKQYTLLEIIDLRNNRPPEPKERFSLAGFRILDMHANSLRLCKNKLEDSSFRYTIHFPFPSFIDLEFDDKTLNMLGKFKIAYGPVAPFSYEFQQQPTSQEMETLPEVPPKYAEVTYNIVSQILFAWRLPVAFTHHGVVIEYKELPQQNVATVLMQPFNPNNMNIISSELRISPLFSRHSDVKFGIRFRGGFDTEGSFKLLDWDKEPVFSTMYPTPGKEMSMGFATRSLDITLADWNSNPVARGFDFQWDGEIQFSFFGWQTSDFLVKDIIPKKQSPTSFSGSGTGCDNDGLEVQIYELTYSVESLTPFSSKNCEVYEIDNGIRRRVEILSFQCSSYLNSTVYLDYTERIVPELSIPERNNIKLINAIHSEYIKDLVCYDDAALDLRQEYNIPGSCCDEYYIGTLQVTSPQGTVIMRASKTKYYPGISPITLDLSASKMELLSRETASEYYSIVNIPSAQLALGSEGIEGAFGATYTPIAMMLPYEGEFRFFINDFDGHFYVHMAGSFTYYLRFRGEIFIVHAPYGKLLAPPPFLGVTNILEDLSLRALFPGVEDFKSTIGFDTLSEDTIITGFFTAGNAQMDVDIIEYVLSLKIASGPGIYAFEYKNGSASGYNAGTFLNTIASADLLILSLRNYNKLSGGFTPGQFSVEGNFELVGCANAFLFHCEAGVRGNVKFSSESGFDFSGSDAWAHCESGGCN